MSMRKLFVCLDSGILATSLNSLSFATAATVAHQSQIAPAHRIAVAVYQADQSALVKQNKELLLTNRTLARKIATKLGI